MNSSVNPDGEVAGTSYDILQGLVSRSTILDDIPTKGSLNFNDNGTFDILRILILQIVLIIRIKL